MTSEWVSELKAAHEAATPAPWIARHDDYDDLDVIAVKATRPVVMTLGWDDDDGYGEWLSDADRAAGIEAAKEIARMHTGHLFTERGIDAVTIPNMRADAKLIVLVRNALPQIVAALEALAWYADVRNYDDEGRPGKGVGGGWAGTEPQDADWETDHGEKARTALGLPNPWEACACCWDVARFLGSGEPPCPSCGHTVKDCNPS